MTEFETCGARSSCRGGAGAVRALFTGAGIASTDPRVRDLGATARIELPAVLAEAGFEAGNVECAAFGSGGVNAELGRQPRPFG